MMVRLALLELMDQTDLTVQTELLEPRGHKVTHQRSQGLKVRLERLDPLGVMEALALRDLLAPLELLVLQGRVFQLAGLQVRLL